MLLTRLPASLLFATLCLSAAACAGATPAPTTDSPAKAAYNPKFVADWVFPGAISGSWTHLENVQAAR